MLRANAWLIAAYILSGKLGLMLALPPGYASAIFPPAGIAVAAVLIGGMRLLPGVFLGALLLNVWIGYGSAHAFSATGIISALIIAAASMLQAAAGSWLLRRRIGYPAPLDNDRDITTFLLAAPVICLTSASISVTGLNLIGVVAAADFATNWVTWWIGDSIGVLVLLPLTMVIAGEPHQLWRGRASSVAVPMLVSFIIFTAIYVRVSDWERDQTLQDFRVSSARLSNEVRAQIDGQIGILDQSDRLLSGNRRVTRQQFHDFVQRPLTRYPNVVTVAWGPRVRLAERASFEKEQRVDRANFEIRERTASGALVRAAQRDEYFPEIYVEPAEGKEDALGYDPASSADRRSTIERAFTSGVAAATPPVALSVGDRRKMGLIVFMPAFDGSDRKGVVSSVLCIGDLLHDLFAAERGQLAARLIDTETGESLYDSFSANDESPARRNSMRFGGREFSLETSPTAAYLNVHRGWQSWSVLAAGLLGTSLLGALLMLGSGHTARFEAIVEQRTRAFEELRLSDAALAHSEARLRAILQSAMDAIITIDERQNIVLFNHAAESMFLCPCAQAMGGPLARFLPERFRAAHAGHVRSFGSRVTSSRRMGEGRTVTGLRSNGEEFPVDASISRVTEDGNRFYTVILRDITERVRAVEALQRSNQDLQRFAYVASHDLKTPLRAISGFVELLQRNYGAQLDSKAREWIDRAASGARRLDGLIDDLLSYSKLDAAEKPFMPIDCGAALNDALALLEAVVRDTGARITADPLPTVRGDRPQLVQLFHNLIGNAIKYHGDQPPRVHVAAARRSGEWLFSVTDNGIGIEARHHERIFDIFHRLHTQQAYPGTGIGLAICRRLVHRHGGRIWVESRPGAGSTFFFTIPDTQEIIR